MFVSWRGAVAKAAAEAANHPFFDHFLIVGAPFDAVGDQVDPGVETLRVPPNIHYQYPPDKPLPQGIENFCFPTGVPITFMSRTLSSSNLNNLLFGSLWAELEKPENSYVFLLSGSPDEPAATSDSDSNACASPTQLFGICVLLPDLLHSGSCYFDGAPKATPEDELPQQPKAMSIRELYQRTHKKERDAIAPRCYCFITRFPFLQFNFQLLQYLLEKERYYSVLERSNLVSELREARQSAIDTLSAYYLQRQKSTFPRPSGGKGSTSAPASTANSPKTATLNNSVEKSSPRDSTVSSVQLSLPDATFFQSNKDGSGEGVVADWAIVRCFKHIHVDSVLLLFERAMLEKPTLVVCNKLGVLSSLLLSLVPMMRPYTFQVPFIPILPESLLEYLDSPVPFFMGVQSLPQEIRSRIDNTFAIYDVDINSGRLINPNITLSSSSQFQIPHLPKRSQLRARLSEILTDYRSEVSKNIPVKERNERLVVLIASAFKTYQSWLIDQIGAATLRCMTEDTSLRPFLSRSDSLLSEGQKAEEEEEEEEEDVVKRVEEGFFDSESNMNKVLGRLHKSHQAFFGQFFKTQLFSFHAGMIASSINEAQTASVEARQKLDFLIEMETLSEAALENYCKQKSLSEEARQTYQKQLAQSKAYVAQLKQSKLEIEKEAALYSLPQSISKQCSSNLLLPRVNFSDPTSPTSSGTLTRPGTPPPPSPSSLSASNNSTPKKKGHARKKSLTETWIEKLTISTTVDTPLKFSGSTSGHRRTRSSYTAEIITQINSGQPILTPVVDSPRTQKRFFEL